MDDPHRATMPLTPQPGWPWTADPPSPVPAAARATAVAPELDLELERMAGLAAGDEGAEVPLEGQQRGRRRSRLSGDLFSKPIALLALVLVILVGGLGFGLWHGYLKDQRNARHTTCGYAQLTNGRQPTDCRLSR